MSGNWKSIDISLVSWATYKYKLSTLTQIKKKLENTTALHTFIDGQISCSEKTECKKKNKIYAIFIYWVV